MRRVPARVQQPPKVGLNPLKWLRFLAFPLALLCSARAATAESERSIDINRGLCGTPGCESCIVVSRLHRRDSGPGRCDGWQYGP